MAEIIDFQEAAFDAGLKKVLNGTATPATPEQTAQYIARGTALIREQSGITADDVFAIKVDGVTVYGLKRR